MQRSSVAKLCGAQGRENAGMSNVNPDEKSGRRKPEVSYARLIRVGLVGPKSRPEGADDG